MSSGRIRLIAVLALCALPTIGAGVADAKSKKKTVKRTVAIEQLDAYGVEAIVTTNKSKVFGVDAAVFCRRPGSDAEINDPQLSVGGHSVNPTDAFPPNKGGINYFFSFDVSVSPAGQSMVAELDKRTVPKGTYGYVKKKVVCKAATSNSIIGF
jgi:hypothetical protein